MKLRRVSLPIVVVSALVSGCATMEDDPGYTDKVDETGVTLAWLAFPREEEIGIDTQGVLVKAERVTYDLRVFRTGERKPILDIRGVARAGYRLEPLPAAGSYSWRIRPRFFVDGQPRIGSWAGGTFRIP